MRVGVILLGGPIRVLEALFDTGAMCILIREGILSPHMLQPTPSPMKSVTVTGEPLPGGTHEAKTCVLFHASEYGGHERPDWRAQFWSKHRFMWISFWDTHGCEKWGIWLILFMIVSELGGMSQKPQHRH